MKFSEMPYTRPDLDALAQASAQAVAALDGAETAQAQLEACRVYQEIALSQLSAEELAEGGERK